MAIHFKDRETAGKLLAAALRKYINDPTVVIYALPRGGVALGYEVARELHAPLELVIARKIGHPVHEEFAIGAVTEHGEPVFEPRPFEFINPEWLTAQIDRERQEAKRRRIAYGKNKKTISAKNKTVIVVDDGIATGLTLRAALEEMRSQHPSKLLVAVPVAPPDIARQLLSEVDELVILDNSPGYLGSVGAYYDIFPQVTDEEVQRMLSFL